MSVISNKKIMPTQLGLYLLKCQFDVKQSNIKCEMICQMSFNY